MDETSLAALGPCPGPLADAARGTLETQRGAPDAPAGADASKDFAAVYRAHFDFVWAALQGVGAGSRLSLEDAAQDVWLIVARRLPEFRGESAMTTWLFGIVRNVVRNHRRRQLRKGGGEPLDEIHGATQTQANDDAQLSARAALLDVQLFLSTLEERPREVFVCRYLFEMSPREVAAATGLGIVSVYAMTRSLKASFKRWHESQRLES